MTLWRLEWLRLVRTRRLLVLVVLMSFFGLTGPVLARYMEDIAASAGGGVQIIVPPPVPADGIANFAGNAQQLGLIAVVAVAGAALALDPRGSTTAFYRSRVPSLAQLLAPRIVLTATAAVGAYTVGLLAAVYETVVLLGPLNADDVVAGLLLTCLYLVFAVTVVAVASALVSSTIAIVATSLAFLLAMPLAGTIVGIDRWLPSSLLGAQEALVRHPQETVGDYTVAVLVTIAVAGTFVLTSIRLHGRREL